jgi:group I intron endonuclease
MYHFVYLTTNLINNKIYVGKRSTKKLDDGYLGSGIVLKQAVEKYGKENFERTILYYCLSKEDASNTEKGIVDSWFVARTDTYNVMLGGTGGTTLLGKFLSEETKQKMSNSKLGKKRKPFTEETKKKMAEARKHQARPVTSDATKLKQSKSNKGKKRTRKQKLNIKNGILRKKMELKISSK